MIPYILFWIFIAAFSLGHKRPWSNLTFYGLLAFLIAFIGLRNQIGGDWYNYLFDFWKESEAPLSSVLTIEDPGYKLLRWMGSNWGGGIHFLNVACASIFSMGLLTFCRAQPRPWLALTMAFPYLILVVAMGYTRQSAAVGMELFALLALEQGKQMKFLWLVAIGCCFHRTILILLGLLAITLSPSLRFFQLIRFLLFAAAGFGLYATVFASTIQTYLINYGAGGGLTSSGALIRVLLCLIPAIIFLISRKSFRLPDQSNQIWTVLSLTTIAAVIFLALTNLSTMVDRLALYLIPLQIFVGSRIPETRLLGQNPGIWTLILISFSLSILLGWLMYSTYSFAWLPYRNLLIPGLGGPLDESAPLHYKLDKMIANPLYEKYF